MGGAVSKEQRAKSKEWGVGSGEWGVGTVGPRCAGAVARAAYDEPRTENRELAAQQLLQFREPDLAEVAARQLGQGHDALEAQPGRLLGVEVVEQ